MLIAEAAWDKKAEEPVVIDVRKETDVTDYFVICSANSDRGVKSIADNIEKKLKEVKIKVTGIEGVSEGKWILIDTLDVVAHIFYKPMREFYDLESLWIDAPRVPLPFVKQDKFEAV
ncbi:MAG: ribosome silencing factor [Candidatus Dadabacteria bacterium]|nr:ribosome silencing factor [Candidatus Dadabacteria bacterium]NIQ13487.1 ribosome silencing factor [Candidatus Dadabacteria bacterium]